MTIDAPIETPTKAPSQATLPPGADIANWADNYVRGLPVQRPSLSHGDTPPPSPMDEGDGDDRRPHRTWLQQLGDSAKHADVLRAGGLLAMFPQREVKATFKGINAAARSLRYGGRRHDHPAGSAFRGAFREHVRNFDDMTNENRWYVRGVGAVAIATMGYFALTSSVLAPVALSQ